MNRTLVLLLSLGAAPLSAQSPLVGAWKLTFPGAVRMMNGNTTVTQATGVLTITANGDSLTGTLVADSVVGQPIRPPLQMTGVTKGEQGVFKSESKARMRLNGEDSESTVQATWTFKLNGDTLEGFLERRLAGQDAGGGAQPVVGKRIK